MAILKTENKSVEVNDALLSEVMMEFTNFTITIHIEPQIEDKAGRDKFAKQIHTMLKAYCIVKQHKHEFCLDALGQVANFMGDKYDIPTGVSFQNELKRAHLFLNYTDDEAMGIMKTLSAKLKT